VRKSEINNPKSEIHIGESLCLCGLVA